MGSYATFTLAGVTEGVVAAGAHDVRPRQACFIGNAVTGGYYALTQGVFTYVADGGISSSPLTLGDADISATVSSCEGTEVEGMCVTVAD